MQKAHDASKNNWWRNLPDITTPITQDELNRLETTVDVIDDRVVAFDLTKANQSDLLQTIKTITYNTETGVWVFTWWNGSTLTIDQNIEKIPVSFSMSPQGVITMTTSDGTQYTCDIATLIKTYSFLDSATIDFTDTVDQDGNHSITADIKNGSITGDKLQPNYLADCVSAKEGAETAETNAETAETNALAHQYTAEAWAKGTKNGVPVTPSDIQYHNSAEYWAGQARAIVGDKVESFNGRTGTVVAEDGDYESDMIVPATNAIVGQVPVVRNVGTGQEVKLRYVNEDLDIGLKPHIIVISEANSTVRLVKGGITIYATETTAEHFECDVTDFGVWTVHSVLNGEDAQVNLTVDAVKIYTVDDSHFHANITVTYPDGATCALSASGQTTLYATGSPYTFTVHSAGTYTITVGYDGNDYTDTVEVTTTGQTFTKTVPSPANAPVNDLDLWLWYGNVSGTYSTLADVLADSTALSTLMASTDAVDYLVRCTSWVSDITGNQSAMSYIGLNNYCANTLLADSTWASAICNSAYFESVLNAKVPSMTSDTTPSGEVFATGGANHYRVFDGNSTTYGTYSNATGNYIGYDFGKSILLKKASYLSENGATYSSIVFKLQGLNSNNEWEDIGSTFSLSSTSVLTKDYSSNNAQYSKYRVLQTNKPTGDAGIVFDEIQFYGREDV